MHGQVRSGISISTHYNTPLGYATKEFYVGRVPKPKSTTMEMLVNQGNLPVNVEHGTVMGQANLQGEILLGGSGLSKENIAFKVTGEALEEIRKPLIEAEKSWQRKYIL